MIEHWKDDNKFYVVVNLSENEEVYHPMNFETLEYAKQEAVSFAKRVITKRVNIFNGYLEDLR